MIHGPGCTTPPTHLLCAESGRLSDPQGTAQSGPSRSGAQGQFPGSVKDRGGERGDFFGNHSQHLAKSSEQELGQRGVLSATEAVLPLEGKAKPQAH